MEIGRLLLLGGVLGLSACDTGLDTTPTHLHGLWITTDDVYGDTSFEIGPTSLKLDLGPEAGDFNHSLDRIEEEVVGDVSHYVLSYVNTEGAEDALRIVYSEDPAPLIRLENRRNVLWRKSQGGR